MRREREHVERRWNHGRGKGSPKLACLRDQDKQLPRVSLLEMIAQ